MKHQIIWKALTTNLKMKSPVTPRKDSQSCKSYNRKAYSISRTYPRKPSPSRKVDPSLNSSTYLQMLPIVTFIRKPLSSMLLVQILKVVLNRRQLVNIAKVPVHL